MALLVALLGGCGNAYEQLYIGEWASAGEPAVPKPYKPQRVSVTVQTPGEGPEVGAGSLVHARITTKPKPNPDSPSPVCGPGVPFPCQRLVEKTEEAWIWMGSTPVDRGLGDPDLRAPLLGVRSGARLAVSVAPGSNVQVPRRAFLLHHRIEHPNEHDRDYVDMRTGRHGREFELEVLRVCDGRLLRRRAVLKQWGYLPDLPPLVRRLPFAREGELEWLAMHGTCGAAGEKVSFEKGPAHDALKGTLDSWTISFKAAMEHGRVVTHAALPQELKAGSVALTYVVPEARALADPIACFVADTLVHTRQGLIPIEQIKVGDYVLSKPEDGTGQASYKRVVNTFEYDDRAVWFLAFVPRSS